MDLVRHVGRNPPCPAGLERARLVSDAKRHAPAQHDPELFVVVPVLRNDGCGVKLDNCQRQPVAVHRAGGDTVPDLP